VDSDLSNSLRLTFISTIL